MQYAITESAQPFSFLNGVHGKWCKLDFELSRTILKNSFFDTFKPTITVVNNETMLYSPCRRKFFSKFFSRD